MTDADGQFESALCWNFNYGNLKFDTNWFDKEELAPSSVGEVSL